MRLDDGMSGLCRLEIGVMDKALAEVDYLRTEENKAEALTNGCNYTKTNRQMRYGRIWDRGVTRHAKKRNLEPGSDTMSGQGNSRLGRKN